MDRPAESWDSERVIHSSINHIAGRGDHREGLEEYLRSGDHPEMRYYLEHGSWRDKPVSLAGGAARTGDNQCYYNAQTSMGSDKRYVEGYAVSPAGAIPHAWLESDLEILETTPSIVSTDVEYFGVEFDPEHVRRAMLQTVPVVELV